MPVHAAGPRLYRSIKFQHLGKGAGGHGRASNVSLNLTPFVDMMTILVTFLLMVFSASGEIVRAHEGLQMPLASQTAQLQRAPVIVITENDIKLLVEEKEQNTWKTIDIASVQSLTENPPINGKIDALHEQLKTLWDDIKTNVAAQNKRMFSKEELEACQREEEGLPELTDKTGTVVTYCPSGLAVVQADKGTDTRIITLVVTTAKLAQFDKLLFAIKHTTEAPQ